MPNARGGGTSSNTLPGSAPAVQPGRRSWSRAPWRLQQAPFCRRRSTPLPPSTRPQMADRSRASFHSPQTPGPPETAMSPIRDAAKSDARASTSRLPRSVKTRYKPHEMGLLAPHPQPQSGPPESMHSAADANARVNPRARLETHMSCSPDAADRPARARPLSNRYLRRLESPDSEMARESAEPAREPAKARAHGEGLSRFPSQHRLARSGGLVDAAGPGSVRRALEHLRICLHFLGDRDHGFNKLVEFELAFGLGRFDHECAVNDQWEAHGIWMKSVINQT